MIRQTLRQTKIATWCLFIIDPSQNYLPTSTGTGFFVSQDGWMVTAAHVVCDRDGNSLDLALANSPFFNDAVVCPLRGARIIWFDIEEDLALLKVDFIRNNEMFPSLIEGKIHIDLSIVRLEEGAPVYSYGYPLSEISNASISDSGSSNANLHLSGRVTSAIVSSCQQGIQKMERPDVEVYIIDKALNYGNSGGPMISTETGNVHAVCSRFHPVYIPQEHLPDEAGTPVQVMIPSLYGYTTSTANPKFLSILKKYGVPFSEI